MSCNCTVGVSEEIKQRLDLYLFQRSKLIFSISRLLATFIFKMVANGKFRSPKIVVSLTQDTSCYLHEGATAERCVRK